jgi:hypothetical protein
MPRRKTLRWSSRDHSERRGLLDRGWKTMTVSHLTTVSDANGEPAKGPSSSLAAEAPSRRLGAFGNCSTRRAAWRASRSKLSPGI